MMIAVDPRHDSIAIAEANELQIPIIGVMSSDCDVSLVTHAILVNDSLTGSVKLVLEELSAAYSAGKKEYKPKPQGTRQT